MDGKDVRGASKQTANGRRMLVAAVEHGKGRVLGQMEVNSKTNEIPAVRELALRLDLFGCVVTYDEDRCRVCGRDLPRNLACLTNTAISIVRCQPQFRYVPEANRHFANRTDEALAPLLSPPGKTCNEPTSVPNHALLGVRSRCVRVGRLPVHAAWDLGSTPPCHVMRAPTTFSTAV